MRTRRGLCYQNTQPTRVQKKINKRKSNYAVEEESCCKRSKSSPEVTGKSDFLDELPDDIVVCILSKLISRAGCPSDFFNILLTCKRLNALALHPVVLSKASSKSFAVKAQNWSESAHRFLKRCADAGNIEACYTLGMIRFYCLENRGSGASLMAKAAMSSCPSALYSLAVIQFNGSGGSKNDKDLRAGVSLCARAAFLGHIDALRELGHCLQDGYGVRQNISEGRRFLIHANAREVASVLFSISSSASSSCPSMAAWQSHHRNGTAISCPLLSDFGCNVPAPEAHPANRFLVEWFGLRGGVQGDLGLRLCSHAACGRPETRRHEFRRCSVCGAVNYCSRACQALDWKLRHKVDCAPMEQWFGEDGEGNGDADVDGAVVGVEDDDDEDPMVES
ncbi:zinc finger protein [Macleaya cordata]|uniref:Zinc finger protein n=1 Tax=Macleaya cordata TaxID=56857 RepID=A0A200R443_MACCD|nr:zinc finger protein [Macleaya cordata]